MNNFLRALTSFLAVGVLSASLAAQTSNARYDNDIQTRVTQQLAKQKNLRGVQATTEDGIVTLSGNVDLYQQKLDAAKKVRKLDQSPRRSQPGRRQLHRARCRSRGETRAPVAL